ncbi:hypothetical protein COT49_01515 [candidate division WWE3 bacterium CG08_land_8_20_14_0_20_40_13]|uniref:Prepilin-type N-terminal cleavage/methylation domain-containing protein n=1 Tax=candidate division WWE3 bacterium CG08_land_8_20_14_0_20_40_13 TaxID=1975084 RepID=A0A2H0XDZ8_UNCKA|nr:MAG: hypothetical protein COT49_01515 [candidate division WWE3 bacterium CG08_land_8_20_14_0_20_40_13]
MKTNNGNGFTLIELLIVIAIIGILAGLVIAVINPQRQLQRAKEGVTRANLAKICQAVLACQSSLSSYDATKCDSFDEIGVYAPTTPAGVSYWPAGSGGAGATNWAGAYAQFATGTGNGVCQMRCVVYNSLQGWVGSAGNVVVNSDGNTGCVTQQ